VEDFNLLTTELRKMYDDQAQELNAASPAYYVFPEGYQDPNDSVRAYANWIGRNWRDAGSDEQRRQQMLYRMIWLGLREYQLPKIKPFTNESGRIFNINELFDCAAGFKSPPKAYERHQQDQPGDTRKRNFQPSISEFTETTETNSGNW
jgi:hypothetical protein